MVDHGTRNESTPAMKLVFGERYLEHNRKNGQHNFASYEAYDHGGGNRPREEYTSLKEKI